MKIFSISLLLSTITFGVAGCGCNNDECKVTFVSEGNSDIIRYVKKGKTLVDIPQTPDVKGKYCVWDTEDFYNIQEDKTVTALCYSTVTNLTTNIASEIDVDVFSEEADLDYILKDLELEVTFESGETKKVYEGEYVLTTNGYDKNVSGSYTISIGYNNAKKDVKINVNKIDDYALTVLVNGDGYYNEGLPELEVTTNVDGNISFDSGQSLYIGTKNYNWTFVPTDTNKYAIRRGSVNVSLIGASSINANKTEITMDFGSDKEEIIAAISEGLVVEARYGNKYKVIDSKYYNISSDNFVNNKSGTFDFKIGYNSDIYTTIKVNISKCEDYSLTINELDEFIIKDNSSLNDVLNLLTKNSDVEGTIAFSPNQKLIVGEYEYEYVFTPTDYNYASKIGKVKIHSYKAQSIDFETISSFKYGTSISSINSELKQNVTGTIYYNDGLSKQINSENVKVTVSVYNSLVAGNYEYLLSYNDEIEVTKEFALNKRILVLGEDYIYKCQDADPNNYETMPYCHIEKVANTEFDFDPNLFSIVPIPGNEVEVIETGVITMYRYKAELVPDESISNNYDRVVITVDAIVK